MSRTEAPRTGRADTDIGLELLLCLEGQGRVGKMTRGRPMHDRTVGRGWSQGTKMWRPPRGCLGRRLIERRLAADDSGEPGRLFAGLPKFWERTVSFVLLFWGTNDGNEPFVPIDGDGDGRKMVVGLT